MDREGSADNEHGAVGQVGHLVRGAAKEQAGQVAVAPRAHDDGADVVGLGILDDRVRRTIKGSSS
jgi:hypothetical protein